MGHTFYRDTDGISLAGCWEDTKKVCKSSAGDKRFPIFSGVLPTELLRQ